MHCNAFPTSVSCSLSIFKISVLDERILIVCIRQEKTKELNCLVLPLPLKAWPELQPDGRQQARMSIFFQESRIFSLKLFLRLAEGNIVLLKCSLTHHLFTVRSEKWVYPLETTEIVLSNHSTVIPLEFSSWNKPFLSVFKWITVCLWLHTAC